MFSVQESDFNATNKENRVGDFYSLSLFISVNTCLESLMSCLCFRAQSTMTSASCCYASFNSFLMYSPRSTILPKRFLPHRKFLVEQFHRRFRNWCWHSMMAIFAPFAIAARTPGFSRASRRCFLRSVAWMAGSIYTWTGVTGEILLGSPAFAIPLERKMNFFLSFKFFLTY